MKNIRNFYLIFFFFFFFFAFLVVKFSVYLSRCVFVMFTERILDSPARMQSFITKTCLYNFDPLAHHFYIAKLGFTWVYIIFLISAQNIDCGYSSEPPRQGGSNEYPQSMF